MARALDIVEVPGLLEAMIAGLDPSVEIEERGGEDASTVKARPARRPSITGPATGAVDALRRHWPEYLMEGAGLGLFMVSAGLFGTLLFHPSSPAAEPLVRQALMGLIMGLTAIGLIYSPWASSRARI
jgi:hypothetical protein